MAIFRKVHTSFWSDSFISDLDRDKKLFYLYLITNERTKQCGVYEITKKQISFDLGYKIDTVSILLEYFIKRGKIRYNEKTNELALGNWLKFNSSTSPKVKACIDKEFKLVKDTVLIEYVRSMDTESQEEQEQEQEEEQEEEQEAKKIIPTESEFLAYCQDIKEYPFSDYAFSLKSKYEAWVSNGWKDGHNNEIKNWKSKIKNALPFMKATPKSQVNNGLNAFL